ncbi:MAG TPA: hypothetical protein VN969_32590 [Streptosporangiaceae bacterium]|nr:hypothetical protein [Streptosporangiaceae bacterium]
MRDIEGKLPFVDDCDVLKKAESDRLLRLALEMSRPVNWWGTGLAPHDLLPIAEQGIPVKWVPAPTVLKALAAALPGDRVALLLSYTEEILSNCRSIIDSYSADSFGDTKVLLLRAFDAFDAGFHEAAIALAVAVAEGHALWASRLRTGVLASLGAPSFDQVLKNLQQIHKERGYRLAEKELASGTLNQDFDIPRRALIAPIPTFFTPFHPDKGEPVPVMLSRHVVTHQPTIDHFSRGNAIMAMMLATSLFVEREEHRDYIYIATEP